MLLNEYGKIAFNEWTRTPQIRLNVLLDVFVIMPNHMHCIIIINGTGELHSPMLEDSPFVNSPDFDYTNQPDSAYKGECDSPLRSPSNTIGAIVRGYKSAVTKQINLLCPGIKIWQRNYYEHIIRTECAYQNISDYIINNPFKWEEDKFYS